MDCGSTKKEQIGLINSLFSDYGRVWISKTSVNGKTQIEAFLDESFGFLLNCRQKIDRSVLQEGFVPFFAGFTDAEGSIFITNGKAAYSLGNYDNELLEMLREGLTERGIESVRMYRAGKRYCIAGGYRQRQHYWHLKITKKESLLKLFNMLGPHIRHEKRKRDIQKALDNINMRNFRVKL